MADQMDLHKLVKNAFRRGLLAKSFLYLFEQLDRRELVSGKEMCEYLMRFTSRRSHDLSLQQYCLAVASSSPGRMEQFWTQLVDLVPDDQRKHFRGVYDLVMLKRPHPVAPEIVASIINEHFPRYFEHIISEKAHPDRGLVHLAAMVWASTIDNYPTLVQADRLKLLVLHIQANKSALDDELAEYFVAKCRSFLLASNVELAVDFVDGLDPSHGQSLSLIRQLAGPITNMKKNNRLFEIKKYLWLLASMKNWTFNQDSFLKDYEKFCMSKSQSHIVKKSYLLVYDIILLMFNGFAVSLVSDEPPYVIFNWNNFIITRLPHILSSVKFHAADANETLETLEDAILNAFNSLNELTVRAITALDAKTFSYTDLRQAFIKSCVYSGLLATASFHRFFPMEARTTQQMLSHEMHAFRNIESVQKGLDKTLLNVSCEFTSLEESGLFEYIQALPKLLKYLRLKQIEYTEVLLAIFVQLIDAQDSEKLYRLVLALVNNSEAFKVFAFNAHRGPLDILERLIVFLDRTEWAADEDNFQESYTHFGVILLGVISVVNIFELDFSKVVVRASFTSDYLNNFYYRLCDNLSNTAPTTSEEENTIVQNYNELCRDWINALFDESNDGLPDDLIRAIHVKQIYKLVPIVFQQAVTATEADVIDMKMLANGIDYLSQPFLVTTMVSIVRWLLSRIETSGVESTHMAALYELVRANCRTETDDSMNELWLIFRGVLLLVGRDILMTIKRFPNWQNTELARKVCDLIPAAITMRPVLVETPGIGNDASLGDQLKAAVLYLVKGDDEQLRMVALLVHRMEASALVEYLEAEIAIYEKSVNNSEDIRVFVHFVLFYIVTCTVCTSAERQSWLDVFSSKGDTKERFGDFDTAFARSLEWHYSSIFNSNTDQDMDDDLFMEDSGDLSLSSRSLVAVMLELRKSAEFLARLLKERTGTIPQFLHDFTREEIKTAVTGG